MPSFFDLPLENRTGGLMADAITRYLEDQAKKLDTVVLHEMEQAFRRTIMRQLMQPRDTRAGKESCTLYSHPCPRKARFIYDGVAREAVKARTMLKFLLGDMVELTVLGIARLAGLDVGLNNEDLTVAGASDGKSVAVHPDGLLNANGKHYNLEVKSCDSQTFDRWLANGGPSDDWGYLTQATMEIQAWREHEWDVNETCFVAVSTGTRQGSIAEWILPYSQDLYDGWQYRRTLRQQKELPPIPYAPVPEMAFKKGKDCDAMLMAFGEPKPRLDKNERIHGWDYLTGRETVGTVCTYCDFLSKCYPRAVMELDGSRPIWVIPPPESPLFTGPMRLRETVQETE